ncbi:hypothetical protein DUNSADRAFT_7834 [Dunaliella salina]|uniref:Encoded protein n=1 Tax=Dunaliella salina TaxID=3046 RepID=A0ABQ7GKP0_DUNSA|nr:hypothetical protein DUNSADRAFT_7834 [Dunaliella salina]|eukprot:KAF5835159.1 hypothetical protein DUNSADRAFT_7834 [Dunaliella salina]
MQDIAVQLRTHARYPTHLRGVSHLPPAGRKLTLLAPVVHVHGVVIVCGHRNQALATGREGQRCETAVLFVKAQPHLGANTHAHKHKCSCRFS